MAIWKYVMLTAVLLFAVSCTTKPTLSPEAEEAYAGFSALVAERAQGNDYIQRPVFDYTATSESLLSFCELAQETEYTWSTKAESFKQANERIMGPLFDKYEFDEERRQILFLTFVTASRNFENEAFCEAVQFHHGGR